MEKTSTLCGYVPISAPPALPAVSCGFDKLISEKELGVCKVLFRRILRRTRILPYLHLRSTGGGLLGET